MHLTFRREWYNGINDFTMLTKSVPFHSHYLSDLFLQAVYTSCPSMHVYSSVFSEEFHSQSLFLAFFSNQSLNTALFFSCTSSDPLSDLLWSSWITLCRIFFSKTVISSTNLRLVRHSLSMLIYMLSHFNFLSNFVSSESQPQITLTKLCHLAEQTHN